MASKDLGEPKQVETIKMPLLVFCFIVTGNMNISQILVMEVAFNIEYYIRPLWKSKINICLTILHLITSMKYRPQII